MKTNERAWCNNKYNDMKLEWKFLWQSRKITIQNTCSRRCPKTLLFGIDTHLCCAGLQAKLSLQAHTLSWVIIPTLVFSELDSPSKLLPFIKWEFKFSTSHNVKFPSKFLSLDDWESRLSTSIGRILPPSSHAWLSENLEPRIQQVEFPLQIHTFG